MFRRSLITVLLPVALAACGPETPSEADPCGPWAHLYQGNCVLNGPVKVTGGADGGTDSAPVDRSACEAPGDEAKNVIVTSGSFHLQHFANAFTYKSDPPGGGSLDSATNTFKAVDMNFTLTDSTASLGVDFGFKPEPTYSTGPLIQGMEYTIWDTGGARLSNEVTGYFKLNLGEAVNGFLTAHHACLSPAGRTEQKGSFVVHQNEYLPNEPEGTRSRITITWNLNCHSAVISGGYSGCAHIVR